MTTRPVSADEEAVYSVAGVQGLVMYRARLAYYESQDSGGMREAAVYKPKPKAPVETPKPKDKTVYRKLKL